MKRKLRKGDQVVVITGNDRGKMGKILLMREERVVVEGVNVRKKHIKKSQEHQKGQIIDIECPINISNVKPCVEGQAVKLFSRENKAGEKELFYNDVNNKPVAYRTLRKVKSK